MTPRMLRTFRVPVVLLYHSVRYAAGGSIYRISITPERFERHVEFLTAHYRVVPLTELVSSMTSRTRVEGMASITFDDGYVDNLAAARDILRKYRASATIFIPTGYVGRPYFWWDALHTVSTSTSAYSTETSRELRTQFPSLELGPDINEAEWFRVWDSMRRQPLCAAYFAVQELADRLSVDLYGLPRPVTPRELTELAQWPFEIGSHAVSHRPLPSLTIEELRSELLSSRTYLEGYTGEPVRAFSYPFGLFDRGVVQNCRDAGYSCAVSLVRDHRVEYSDSFDIPRLDGGDGDVDELIAELEVIEDMNSRAFAAHRLTAPTKSNARSRQRQPTDTQPNVRPSPLPGIIRLTHHVT